jgi:hypothetical protein
MRYFAVAVCPGRIVPSSTVSSLSNTPPLIEALRRVTFTRLAGAWEVLSIVTNAS